MEATLKSIINLPENYPYRYTLHWLIMNHCNNHGLEKKEVYQELSEVTGRGIRSIELYERIKSDTNKGAIPLEVSYPIADYFGISIEYLLSKNVINETAKRGS